MVVNIILIVEDNPDDTVAYTRYLKKMVQPEKIVSFAYASEALEYISNQQIDCVLLDYQLPDISGVDFIHKLNKINLKLIPPVVMLTGSGDERVAVQALKAGAADYLIKGEVTAESLYRAISNAMDKATLLEQVKSQEQALKQRAYNDFLTGIPNRARFDELGKQALSRTERHYTHTAILMVDLDGFKNVNDTYGHDTGDELLKLVTTRFKNIIRNNDTPARLGGDEFALILENINTNELKAIASKLVSESEKEIIIQNNLISISSSIGISIYPDDGKDLADLLKKADIALYQAKETGKGKFIRYADNL
ncbi:GGDEF domain-containing response regulator [Francisellaceae bacterium]|nr:GGDEF domain-containing response regulator [Francisellaceae bacterium]